MADMVVCEKLEAYWSLIPDNLIMVDYKGSYEEMFKAFGWTAVGTNEWKRL